MRTWFRPVVQHGEVGVALDIPPLISIMPVFRFVRIDNGEGEMKDTTDCVATLGARIGS